MASDNFAVTYNTKLWENIAQGKAECYNLWSNSLTKCCTFLTKEAAVSYCILHLLMHRLNQFIDRSQQQIIVLVDGAFLIEGVN